jgi:AcrR family transcriptional regulator
VGRTSTTRARLVEKASELFRRQGYDGTGIKQILAAAEAPFGSLYHFFPGGKEELGAEAIKTSGAMYQQLIALIFDPAPDVATGVEHFFLGAAETLRQSDYADACPIATIALQIASTSEPLRKSTAAVFESWLAELEARFVAGGVPKAKVRPLSLATLGALEGAFVLARTLRTTQPVEIAGANMAALVRGELGPARKKVSSSSGGPRSRARSRPSRRRRRSSPRRPSGRTPRA